MDELRAALARRRPAYARWHEHVRCDGVAHLRAELARVELLKLLRGEPSTTLAGLSIEPRDLQA